jgi:hypothetical protein
LSENDLEYVKDGIRKASILPRLTEQPLRDRVEQMICRQGPILTLETFAQDARLLQSRVRQNLKIFLLGMNRKKARDTLRKRVSDAIGREFDTISRASGLPIASHAERQALITRCYRHLFLCAISSKESVTASCVRDVVEQELGLVRIHERVSNLQGPITDERALALQAPADDLPDNEVDFGRRHGRLLFDSSIAKNHLYYDSVSDSPISTLALTQLFMAKHIVRIFLVGDAISANLSIEIDQPCCSAALSTPSHRNSPDSACSGSRFGCSPESPTCIAIQSTPIMQGLCRSLPQVRKATVKSMAASLVDVEHSPAKSTPRPDNKRSLSLHTSQQDVDLTSTPAKRPCQGWLGQREETTPRPSSGAPPYRRPSLWIQTGQSQAVNQVSPSVYSTDRGLSISQKDDGRSNGTMHSGKEFCYDVDTAQNYIALLDEKCLCSERSHCSHSQSATDLSTLSHNGTPPLTRFPPNELRLRMPVHDVTEERHYKEGSGHVLFKSTKVKGNVYRARRDDHSIKLFVASQKAKDGNSRFWYMDHGLKKHATNGDQLCKAIEKPHVRTVFVDSRSLGRVED